MRSGLSCLKQFYLSGSDQFSPRTSFCFTRVVSSTSAPSGNGWREARFSTSGESCEPAGARFSAEAQKKRASREGDSLRKNSSRSESLFCGLKFAHCGRNCEHQSARRGVLLNFPINPERRGIIVAIQISYGYGAEFLVLRSCSQWFCLRAK